MAGHRYLVRLDTVCKVAKRCRRELNRAAQKSKALLARSIFSLPLLARHDPRSKVVRFKSHCTEVARFPASGQSDSTDWYLKLRESEFVARNDSISSNRTTAAAFKRATVKYQSGTLIRFPEVFLACLHGGRIYGDDSIVLSRRGHIFLEACAVARRKYLEQSGILYSVFRPSLLPLQGDFCVVANRSVRNYYHWLFEVLPKFSLIEEIDGLSNVPIILPTNLGRFHQESLRLAGVAAQRIAYVDAGYWQLDRLFFLEMLAPSGNPSPHAVAWLRKRLLREDHLHVKANRRLYLTRRDASQRRVLNEGEIVEFLKGRGFEVVCPGDFCFAEQIHMFASASAVIAAHGAGGV